MITTDQAQGLVGRPVVGEGDDKIGKVGQVYLDDDSGQPEWVTVNTGLFGNSESFVPLGQATVDGDTLRVPYAKDTVKDAPRVAADGHLDKADEAELYRYYGLDDGAPPVAGTGRGDVPDSDRDRRGDGVTLEMEDRTVGHDTSAPPRTTP